MADLEKKSSVWIVRLTQGNINGCTWLPTSVRRCAPVYYVADALIRTFLVTCPIKQIHFQSGKVAIRIDPRRQHWHYEDYYECIPATGVIPDAALIEFECGQSDMGLTWSNPDVPNTVGLLLEAGISNEVSVRERKVRGAAALNLTQNGERMVTDWLGDWHPDDLVVATLY